MNISFLHATEYESNALPFEPPTPHNIAVLVLIKEYMKLRKPALLAGLPYSDGSRRQFCMLLLKLMQNPDMPYDDLLNLLTSLRYKKGPNLLIAFEDMMSKICSDIVVLLDLVEYNSFYFRGVFGPYLRQIRIRLARMSFTEILLLHKDICLHHGQGNCDSFNGAALQYIPKTLSKHMMAGESTPRNTKMKAAISPFQNDQVARLEAVFEDSLSFIESSVCGRKSQSKWSLKRVDLFVAQQCNLLENNEAQALTPIELQTKLLEVIDDHPMNSGAYFLSYMNQMRLRDYFGAEKALRMALDNSANQITTLHVEKGHQHQAMNLAVMHVHFEHYKEALKLFLESTQLSLEYCDKRALDIIGIWLNLLNYWQPINRGDSTDLRCWSTLVLFCIKYNLEGRLRPLELFDAVDEVNKGKSFLEQTTNLQVLRSALWGTFGNYEIASLYSQQLLQQKKIAVCRDLRNSEMMSSKLGSVCLWVALQGKHHESEALMQHARERFSRFPIAKSWMISQCHLKIQHAIYRCKWQDAMRACCQLHLFDEIDGSLALASIHLARRQFHRARDLLDAMLGARKLTAFWKVRALIISAQCGICEKRPPTESTHLLVEASMLAESLNMFYDRALADMILTQTLLEMKAVAKAVQAVQNSMDIIYRDGTYFDRARMDFISMKCFVEAADSDDVDGKLKRFLRGLSTLERAIESFEKLEAHSKVLDILVYIAKTFNELGEIDKRNDYARKFREYYLENPISKEYLGMVF